jgi:hypothetical protein
VREELQRVKNDAGDMAAAEERMKDVPALVKGPSWRAKKHASDVTD